MAIHRVDTYWSGHLGVQPENLYQPGVHVVPHVRPGDENFAYAFVKGSTCVLCVPSSEVEDTTKRAAAYSASSLLNDDNLRIVLGRPIHHTIGPAYQGYVDRKEFSPQFSPEVRQISKSSPELGRLQKVCDSTAWYHSAIDPTGSALFAYVLNGAIVAVAHYSMWTDDTASIGVLTHPAHRGRGHGKAVVSAAIADAFERGHLVVLQTLESNVAAVGIAKAIGTRDYARTVAVHLIGPS